MLYQGELVVPPNTLITDTVETELKVIRGTVSQVEVMFPPGSAGLLKVAVFYRRFRLWPTSPDMWFYADNYVFKWGEDFRFDSAPFSLRIVGYNEDELYSHSVIVRLAMNIGNVGLTDYLKSILTPQVKVTGD
jgi:hypothetical protein